jgi:NitT/TauT family transport system permease protein
MGAIRTTMGKKMRNKKDKEEAIWIRAAQQMLAILLFLALWEILPRIGVLEPVYLPPFSVCLRAYFRLAVSGVLLGHIGISLARALTGFGIAVAAGIPLGVLIGLNHRFERFVNPLLQLIRQTSPLSLIPVFILLLGIGEDTKVVIVLWGTFWPILMNTISGVRSTPPLLIKMSRSMGISQVALIKNVILPSANPEIFTGLRLSATISILMLTGAEMVGANSGIGYFVLYSQQIYKIPDMYAGIINIALIGLLFNFILIRIERRALHWRESLPE